MKETEAVQVRKKRKKNRSSRNQEKRDAVSAMRDLKKFGESLREVRMKKNITLGELSVASKSSVSHLSRLENGLGSPSTRVLRRVAKALDCEIRMLIVSEKEKVVAEK